MYYFVIAFGYLFVAVGVGALLLRIRLFRHSVKVDGKLVPWKESRQFVNHREVITYRPVVAFADADGSTHQIESESGTDTKPPLGHVYPVRYDPGNPVDATIATFVNFWIVPFIFLAGGALLLLLGHVFGAAGG
jgi:hypothetical protein